MSRFSGPDAQAEVKRLRESRVNMLYRAHLPDGTIRNEPLPLSVGVVADLSGDLKESRAKLRDRSREFRLVSAEKFDDFLKQVGPRLELKIPDRLNEGQTIRVTLNFERLADFHPDKIVEKIPALRRELEIRLGLKGLSDLVESDAELLDALTAILDVESERTQLIEEQRQLDASRPADAGPLREKEVH